MSGEWHKMTISDITSREEVHLKMYTRTYELRLLYRSHIVIDKSTAAYFSCSSAIVSLRDTCQVDGGDYYHHDLIILVHSTTTTTNLPRQFSFEYKFRQQFTPIKSSRAYRRLTNEHINNDKAVKYWSWNHKKHTLKTHLNSSDHNKHVIDHMFHTHNLVSRVSDDNFSNLTILLFCR